MAGPPPAPPAEVGGAQLPGAGGVGGAQILQQIEQLLMQLAQSEPDPGIQQAVSKIGADVSALQQVVGQKDMGAMQSGVNNPSEGGGAGGMGAMGAMGAGGLPEGSAPEEAAETPGEEASEEPKDFKGANKAAMAAFKKSGGKSYSKSGSKETDRTKNKKKG